MDHQESPFIEPGIDPLLSELSNPVGIYHAAPSHPARPILQNFICHVFRQAYEAEVVTFYPDLVGFTIGEQLSAVVGYRDGSASSLFSEQYLDTPADRLASRKLGMRVERGQMVEVGNLAITDPGQARWLIAASTVFLAAAGYRWVLFTATKPLANAFRRLGLKPLLLGSADPGRLQDSGASWGSYYRENPCVYIGDIQAGLNKLHSSRCATNANLDHLLKLANSLGVACTRSSERYLSLAAADS